jgi:cellulose biosynthesis protein BcsQ
VDLTPRRGAAGKTMATTHLDTVSCDLRALIVDADPASDAGARAWRHDAEPAGDYELVLLDPPPSLDELRTTTWMLPD